MDRYEKYIGKILDGRYKIESIVGVGGMALVLKAEDMTEKRTVAIKMLNDEYCTDEKAEKRFVNESKAVAMLSHPNIVKIYDVALAAQRKYIVMEYIDGITLKDYIDKKGVLAWREAIHYTCQILDALDHAHSKGIIHRDVKPQNIMLLSDGSIKVTDFGIAKIPNSESITMTDKAIGTVNYISPEQASANKVDACSDMYSTGVMLYEMVTGKLPFIADNPVAVAMMQVSDTPVAPHEINPDIPKGLEQIILKAMNKEPTARFASCAVMKKALSFLNENPNTVFTEKKRINTGKATQNGPKDAGKPTFLPIIGGVTLAFFVVAIVSACIIGIRFFNTEKSETGSDIIVPELVGKIYDEELEKYLEENKFKVIDVKYVSLPESEKNEIIAQDPEENAKRKLSYNSDYYDIKLTVNKGLTDVILDDYSLMDAREVRLELEKLGMSVVEIEQSDDYVLKNYVISTSPASGELIKPGTIVKVFVSKGKQINTVVMPEVIGLERKDAERAIISAGLSVGEITYEESDEGYDGKVISASSDAGDRLPEKISRIDLVICIGEKEPLREDGKEDTETSNKEDDGSKGQNGEDDGENDKTPSEESVGV